MSEDPNMTETITTATLFNSFNVFREIFTGITALSTLNSKFGLNSSYYEDFPNVKGVDSPEWPFVLIETEMDQDSLTLTGRKQMMYTTVVTIYSDYFVEKDKTLLNSYLNAIVFWFNANKDTTRWTYGLFGTSDIQKARDIDVVSQKKVVLGILTFNYHVTLNTD